MPGPSMAPPGPTSRALSPSPVPSPCPLGRGDGTGDSGQVRRAGLDVWLSPWRSPPKRRSGCGVQFDLRRDGPQLEGPSPVLGHDQLDVADRPDGER